MQYPIYGGVNYLGRADQLPVDIDFDEQERADRVWTSRQHATITWEDGKLFIEDLKMPMARLLTENVLFQERNNCLPWVTPFSGQRGDEAGGE